MIGRCTTVFALVALVALTSACTASDTPAGDDETGAYASPTCEVGTLDDKGRFTPWRDGDSLELVEGYQGYMLLIGAVHVTVGEMPDKPNVSIEVDRDGGKTSRTTYVHAGQRLCDKSHPTTERLEMWLVPPDPTAFVGRKGTVNVAIKGRDGACSTSVNITFVDELACKHFDDGTIYCPGEGPGAAVP